MFGQLPGNRLGHFLQRQWNVPRAGMPESFRRFAFIRVADHDARRFQGNFVGKPADVLPVDREQQIELVTERLQGMVGEPYQRRRFAAADLRPAGADHDSVQAGFRGGVEQQRSRRHHAAAAAAREAIEMLESAPRERALPRSGGFCCGCCCTSSLLPASRSVK